MSDKETPAVGKNAIGHPSQLVQRDPRASLMKKRPEELRAILDQLKAGLERLYADRLRGVYLYGSYSRGGARAGSDIDVLIVLDRMDSSWDEIKRTSELRAGLSLEHDVTLNTLFVAEEQWKRDDVSVLRAVRREGILV